LAVLFHHDRRARHAHARRPGPVHVSGHPVGAPEIHSRETHARGSDRPVLALCRSGVDLPLPPALPGALMSDPIQKTRTPWLVYAALIALLVVTVLAAQVDLSHLTLFGRPIGWLNLAIAMLIAVIKA